MRNLKTKKENNLERELGETALFGRTSPNKENPRLV